MGTRNLTVVKNRNEDTKIALYGQWDGYPEYSGLEALRFIRDEANQEKLLNNLDLVEFISEEESEAIWETFEHDDNDPTKAQTAMPGLTRDTGISILGIVANATKPIKMIDNSDFRNDTLFCEGVYEIDFSTNKFISTYHETIREFFLENLPTDEEYLAAFETELENA
jgi:hypothetical protein